MDEQVDVHACGRGAARAAFIDYSADGRGAEEVGGRDEVVGMPLWGRRGQRSYFSIESLWNESAYHVLRLFRIERDRSRAIALDVLLYQAHCGLFR